MHCLSLMQLHSRESFHPLKSYVIHQQNSKTLIFTLPRFISTNTYTYIYISRNKFINSKFMITLFKFYSLYLSRITTSFWNPFRQLLTTLFIPQINKFHSLKNISIKQPLPLSLPCPSSPTYLSNESLPCKRIALYTRVFIDFTRGEAK